ncbi:phosphate starvation-inducible protein PhoH, predicted ATPase [Sphaerochaeta pleomorpha str. Grapes]|uniref:PhoH-like protein n=1 Tax=Sphaerochaeta pleomorpha (strain ATCC BAA-1885 / DSM 22778 / Grapes) TaxID=158190 RepID=G8QVH9_SPHPG|nr:PhoH family protein [Sphaerochaeta pleomorpha]AEV28212.1 phosphate starvation-inducible protein PhoH, predicted ATPase [Sphaerochaeta pleomorpha str. Grapes]
MDRNIEFDSEEQMCRVCGINDRNIPYMEMLLGCDLFVKGISLSYTGDNNTVGILFSSLLNRLKQLADKQILVSEAEIFMEFQSLKNTPSAFSASQIVEPEEKPFIYVQNRFAYPKGPRQEQYIRAMENSQIVFGIGPAGTGKTFLAITYALSLLLSGKRQKLILTRPIVEAGENLGFLPGDLAQKINPYLRPLYDAMETMITASNIHRLEENDSIEIAPLAYMRGRSLQNAIVILDEAQNTTREQMQMFLTRLGENCSAIITGDISQVDLPRNKDSGLIHAIKLLEGIEGIEIVTFDSRDVVRSRIVQKIIDAYASESERGARGNVR